MTANVFVPGASLFRHVLTVTNDRTREVVSADFTFDNDGASATLPPGQYTVAMRSREYGDLITRHYVVNEPPARVVGGADPLTARATLFRTQEPQTLIPGNADGVNWASRTTTAGPDFIGIPTVPDLDMVFEPGNLENGYIQYPLRPAAYDLQFNFYVECDPADVGRPVSFSHVAQPDLGALYQAVVSPDHQVFANFVAVQHTYSTLDPINALVRVDTSHLTQPATLIEAAIAIFER